MKVEIPSLKELMSSAEREVADFLKSLGIWWTYQQPMAIYDEKDRPRTWAPDFFLNDLGIYVEVCGSPKFDYSYRKEIYDREGYRVIFLHLYKKDKWKKYLLNEIKKIHDMRGNLVRKFKG